ncbi:MAG: GDSL-type esterase/lipase family protein [Daejeonella sp.]
MSKYLSSFPNMNLIKKKKYSTRHKKEMLLILWMICSISLFAQPVTIPAISPSTNLPPINYAENRIYSNEMDTFYKKLSEMQQKHDGVVRIVQIGDSHIQADFLSGVVRNGLQQAFGDAGRGLIFPYQVARSNGPSDIKSSSNTSWKANRLTYQKIALECGISGFCIQNNKPDATINFSLQADTDGVQTFNHLKLFTDTNSQWLLRIDSTTVTQLKMNSSDSNKIYHDVSLAMPVTGFSLSTQWSGTDQSFYGALLENDQPGIIYNSIGVNGARYDQYNKTALFWKQLPALEADLYIISLGTNEAQAASFNEAAFSEIVNTFISNLKTASPNAAILITTAIDSYKGGRPNAVLQSLNNFLYNYTTQNSLPLWDLYRVTLGYNASRNWIRKGLMAKDKVHFTKNGYALQGSLLLNALLKGYNDYYTNHQN